MSTEEPEIAGANAKRPSPQYDDQEEAVVLMEEAEGAEAATRGRSQEPGERSPVHKSCNTEDYSVPQIVLYSQIIRE